MASKPFTSKAVVSKFSSKGDLVQIEAENPRTDGFKPFWLELDKAEKKCGTLAIGQMLSCSVSAD